VADITARNAITIDRREIGMDVYVISNDTTYKLVGGILDANWQVVGYGSSLNGSVTLDIGSLGTLVNASTTLTVTGAVVGDTVTVSPSMPSAGVVVAADVTSADTVTLRAHNTTSGTIDPASATFRVKVIKQ
jgi:hypothetical protein